MPISRAPAALLSRLSPTAWIAAIFALAGIILRVQHYLLNPSLWLDEAALALNLIERPLPRIFEHLDYGQLAPIGFLVPVKLLSDLTQASEPGLRLVPLLAGILLLVVIYPIGRSISPVVAMVATGICAFSKYLLYFSVTVKPYESDALVAILYVGMGVALLQPNPSRRRLFLLALGGAAGFWFSFPAIFVALGVVAMTLPLPIFRRDRRQFLRLFAVFAAWGGSFLLSFAYARLQLRGDEAFMYGFWGEYFLPWPPDSQVWFGTLIAAFENPAGVVFKEIAAVLALIGLGWLIVRRSPYGVLFTVPVAIAWVASLLQAYPFFERLILYLAPLLALLVGCGVAAIADVAGRVVRRQNAAAIVTAGLLVVLLTRPALGAAARAEANETFYGFDVREMAIYFKAQRQPEDFLYVHWLIAGSYKYYSYRLEIDRGRLREGPISDLSWGPVIEDVRQYAGVPRMWFMAADLDGHDTNAFVDSLKARGEQLDYLKSRRLNLWLFALD